MRKAVSYLVVLFCLIAGPFRSQEVYGQAKLAIQSVASNPSDTLWYNQGMGDSIISYEVIVTNVGNQKYDGPIKLYFRYNGDVGQTHLKREWTVADFENMMTDTLVVTDTVTPLDQRYKGGDNILIIWPQSDNPSIQAPDTGSTGIYIDQLTATEDPTEFRRRLKVGPNPSNGVIYLHYQQDRSRIEYVRLVSLEGRLVQAQEGPVSEISMEELPAGMYFLTVRFKDGLQGTYRLVKE